MSDRKSPILTAQVLEVTSASGVDSLAGAVPSGAPGAVSTCSRPSEFSPYTEENLYQALFEAANDAIALLENGVFVEVNPSTLRLFRESRLSILGQSFLALSAAKQPDGRDSSEKLQEKFSRALEGWPQTFDWLLSRSDSTSFYSEISLSRVQRANGIQLLAIVRDINDRKRAEEALRLNATQYEANLENTPHVAIQWYDEAGRVLYWNRASAVIYGWSVADVLGETLGRLMFTPEQADEIILSLMAFGSDAQAIGPIEYLVRRKDGSQGWVIATHFTIPMADNRRGFVCMAVDITERKRVETLLRRQEETFRALTESSFDLIMRFDESSRVLYANPIVERTLGFAVENVIGKTMSELGIAAEFCRGWDEAFREVFLVGNVRHLEYARDNGLWFDWLLMPEFDEEHHVRAVIASARDVTERKRTEEERTRFTQQLQQTTKMEAMGRLAGGVAHDFNNLLTAIKGSLNLALLDLDSNSAVGEVLRDASKAANSAAGLTRQLLAFSRKQTIIPHPLDLNEVIVRVEKMLSRLITEDIKLETVLDENLWETYADSGQIEQVLINLVVNAKDAMPHGGKLTIETKNVELDAAFHAEHPRTPKGHYAALFVSDTGCGMTDEVLSHIFEPFFTTKPVGFGTGLGLATIYGAIRQAGGSIEVVSRVGAGTHFSIYLPRLVEQSPSKRITATEGELVTGNETILLVEDDDALRQLSEKMLTRLGYRVLVAPDGAHAIKLATEYEGVIHLVFCDVVLPGMNGKEVAEQLIGLRPTMKVLLTSGYTDDVLTKYALETHRFSFVAKPFTLRLIAEKLRNVLGADE